MQQLEQGRQADVLQGDHGGMLSDEASASRTRTGPCSWPS
jgi:hypothetical protein